MDNHVVMLGPQIAFGTTKQEIEEGILKIRISLKEEMIKRLNELGFTDLEFNFNCNNLSLGVFTEVLQRIRKSIENEKLKKESGKVLCTNSDIGIIIEDIESLSFIKKDSQSFKESDGLKEFLSHIERQSTVLDALLVQMIHFGELFLIVSILTKYSSIEGMEESTSQIMQYDVSLNNNIAEIIELFKQNLQAKTYFLSKINGTLMRTIDDAQGIICLWKQSPISVFFNAVCDQLVQTWIYIDIFSTQYSYQLRGQQETFRNQILSRQFKTLTEKDLRIHQIECIQDWGPIHYCYSDSDKESDEDGDEDGDGDGENNNGDGNDNEDSSGDSNENSSGGSNEVEDEDDKESEVERENEKTLDIFNIDSKDAKMRFQDNTIKEEINKVVIFNPKHSNKVKRLLCKISADAKVIQSYAIKVQNKTVLREALKVLKSKQQISIKRESIILKQLTLRDAQFYSDIFEIRPNSTKWFKHDFETTSDTYKRLGVFIYSHPHCASDHISMCIGKNKHNDCVYIGEVKEGTDQVKHGIGIQVWSSGRIEEGCWENGKQHGIGRVICWNGDCYIGEFKNGNISGHGTHYWQIGSRHEGEWKDNQRHGQGTYYENGDKFSGEWDGNKGQGEINYCDGTKYIGHWDGNWLFGMMRHGLGTLYSADGRVINQGKWRENKYVDKK